MTARLQHRVQIEIGSAVVSTWRFSPEVIGAAWLILLEHYEHGRPFEFWDNKRACARLLAYSKRSWARRRPAIYECFVALRDASELAVQYGRQPISRDVRRAVYARDGGVCRYCAEPVSFDDFHCDHVMPVSRGGSDGIDNLASACRPCNLSKAARTVQEWSGRL